MPGLATHRIELLHEWDHVLEQVRFLLDSPVVRMVGIPGQVGKAGRDTDQAMPIMEVVLEDFLQTVSITCLQACLHRQQIDRCQPLAGPYLIWQDHSHLSYAGLVTGLHCVKVDSLVGLVCGLELKAWVFSLADQQRGEQQQAKCGSCLSKLVSC